MLLLKNYQRCCSSNLIPMKFLLRNYRLSHTKKYVKQKCDSKLKATNAYLQVIGSGSADQPASVVLVTTDQRYIFNCGESIERLCHNSGISIKKINHAFITQTKWNCIGGITNLLFATIATSGFPPTFHGPENLHKIVQRMSYLSIVGGLFNKRFTQDLFKTDEYFEDSKLAINTVTLRHSGESANVYFCKLKACEGSFSLQKSLDKNVPAPMIAKLFQGEDIELEDGTIVTAKEVRDPDYPDMHIIFIDIPNNGFLNDLGTNEKLKKLIEETKSNGVELIVHFTPDVVFKTSRYQYFIETINANRNLVLNERNKGGSVENLYKLQAKLNKIDPKIHPLLGMKLDMEPKAYNPNNDDQKDYGKAPMLYSSYLFRGDPKEYISSVFKDDDDNEGEIDKMLNETKNNYKEILKQKPPLKLIDEEFPRILFLGTGASSSFNYRNSSGILVHLSKDHSILLDCGDSICSQINRFYGDEAPEIYRRLKAVFISHIHLDHHIGLPELFRLRKLYLPSNRKPLRLFCPKDDLKSWLLFYSNFIDSIHSDMTFIDNDIFVRNDLSFLDKKYLNIQSLKTCPVKHYRKSYALSLNLPYELDGEKKSFKLAYSGDLSKCDRFVKMGENADLLIHEATFQTDLIEIALKYRHSTVSTAIEQSKQMRAKHTILTHFSSRYSILPYIDEKLDDNIGIAFDYMEVTPSDLPRLSSLYRKYQDEFPGVNKKHVEKTKNLNEWNGPVLL